MKKTILFLVVFLLFAGCEKKPHDMPNVKQDIVLTTSGGNPINVSVNGNKFDFGGFEGKPLLVVFFATWCPPCKAEMPELAKLQTEFKDKANILAVLLEKDKDPKEVADFIKSMGINFPVTVSNDNFALAQAVGGVRGIPALFLFDANSTLTKIYPGAAQKEMLAEDISKLLK